jgi:hypothetical protein
VTLPVHEDFAGGAAALSGNWTQQSTATVNRNGSGIGVQSATSSSLTSAFYNAEPFDSKQFSQVTWVFGVTGSLAAGGVAVRASGGVGSQNCYLLVGTGTAAETLLYVVVAGTPTSLGSLNTALVNGDRLRLEVRGSILTCKKNGAIIGTFTDSTHTTGSAAVCGGWVSGASTWQVDNWSGGNLDTPGIALVGSRHPGRSPGILGRFLQSARSTDVSAAATTAALSGQAATGSAGTLAPATDKSLSGGASTATAGAIVPALSAALSGIEATGAQGSVTASQPLVGAAATVSTGTLTPVASPALAGSSATTSAGTESPQTVVPLSGLQATTATGTLSATAPGTAALTGQACTASTGTLAPSTSVSLLGSAATAQAGTLVPALSKAVSGNACTTSQGTVSVTLAALPAGAAITATGGGVSPSAAVVLSGSFGTTATGTLTFTQGAVAALSGSTLTISQGAVVVPIFSANPRRFTANPTAHRIGFESELVHEERIGAVAPDVNEGRVGAEGADVDESRIGAESPAPAERRIGERNQ